MIDERTVKAIAAELSIAYMAAHRTAPDSTLQVVAASIADAVPAITADNAHAIFRRAMQVEAIPTVPTLTDAARNLMAETYAQNSSLPQIEYRNPREAWLPSDTLHRRINLNTAIRNYCAAVSDSLYKEYCKTHAHYKDENGKWRFVNPDKVDSFDTRIKDTLLNLYRKYWRKCVCAAGYPAEAPYNLGLVPPTVPEFKAMLHYENQQHA